MTTTTLTTVLMSAAVLAAAAVLAGLIAVGAWSFVRMIGRAIDDRLNAEIDAALTLPAPEVTDRRAYVGRHRRAAH